MYKRQVDGCLPITVIKPDGEAVKGLGEPECRNLSEGQLVQFERYGFCRVDEVTPEIKVFFAHE